MSRGLRAWLSIMFLFIGAMLLYGGYRFTQGRSSDWGAASEEDPEATTKFTSVGKSEFELTDQNGKKFLSSELEGQVWLGNFFFTKCPGQCPAQSRMLQLLHTEFRDQGLKIVSITCDPSHDNPSELDKYSKGYNADPNSWHFLTHSEFEYIESIANEFFQAPLKQLTHADQVYLFGKDGHLIQTFGVIDHTVYRQMQSAILAALNETSSDVEATDDAQENASTDEDAAEGEATS
ncbi:MAG: SCO family protein [Planctomycetales bacterium]|nr:SCO family protein [Planctomycetales bacterium]